MATNYTGDESLNDFIENTYNSTISDIMSQLDGVIETHFGNGIPTLSNEPAKNWNTNALKENHLGDMYYDNDSGIGYRFSKEGSTYKWSEVRDTGVASALEAASRAQDTADGKRRVFVATPTPPYDEGDLWASGTFLKRCINSRTSGRFLEGDWDLATNYTGDESLNAFVDGLFDSTVSDIYNQLDGKLESWYTSTDPSSQWSNDDKPKHATNGSILVPIVCITTRRMARNTNGMKSRTKMPSMQLRRQARRKTRQTENAACSCQHQQRLMMSAICGHKGHPVI